jgi:hypothetical protein
VTWLSAVEALGRELLEQPGGKGLAQLLQRLGRQFFDEQFDEQVVGGHGKKSGGRVRPTCPWANQYLA